MKKLLLLLSALALPATAQAQIVARPFVEGTVANSRFSTNGLVGGINAGMASRNVTLGVGLETDETLSANLGIRTPVVGPVGVYATAGFLSQKGDIGYRLGTGATLNLTDRLTLRGGYQRDDYGSNQSDGGVIGLGFRF